ncbi:hypothetical protein OIO90_006666, partial [Microbotryomycetes sp. JL221]
RCVRNLSFWSSLQPRTNPISVLASPKSSLSNVTTTESPYDQVAQYLLPQIQAGAKYQIFQNRLFIALGPNGYRLQATEQQYVYTGNPSESTSVSATGNVVRRLWQPTFVWGLGGCAIQGRLVG